MPDGKWYQDGLSFECTQCGNCCSGPPGHVWLTRDEQTRIAKRLGRPDHKLSSEHVRRVGFKHSLTEKPNGDCVFLVRQHGKTFCGIYEVRPLQCRTWPFWTENLRSARSWDDAAERCPGMNHGTHYGFVAIEDIRLKRTW